MARHEIIFEDMIAQGATLSNVLAYILLRNNALSAEDKKRVVIEAKGSLKYESVTRAIRMFGATFCLDVQGQTKSYRSKTYEVNHMQEADEESQLYDDSSYVFTADASDVPEAMIEQLFAEGDEDALVAHQFEEAMIELQCGRSAARKDICGLNAQTGFIANLHPGLHSYNRQIC